jgi:hypothetical protein
VQFPQSLIHLAPSVTFIYDVVATPYLRLAARLQQYNLRFKKKSLVVAFARVKRTDLTPPPRVFFQTITFLSLSYSFFSFSFSYNRATSIILLNRVQGMNKQYFAADSFKEVEECAVTSQAAALDYVARHTLLDFHPIIKTNSAFRLLRNFSVDYQLVKHMSHLLSRREVHGRY